MLPPPQSPVEDLPEGKFPRLVESWLVHYASQSHPFLDVETKDDTGSGILEVVIDLTGPNRTYPDLPLKYLPEEGEWRLGAKFFPRPMEGGLWFVSRVRIKANDGSRTDYKAEDPYDTFRCDFSTAGGAETKNRLTPCRVGVLYVTEPGSPLFYLQTSASHDGQDVMPVMEVYSENDLERWIAVNAEPEMKCHYPRLAMPLSPGKTYYIRINGDFSEDGHYSIVIGDAGFIDIKTKKASLPDSYEPDDSPSAATPLKPGEVQNHSLVRQPNKQRDVDWFVFTVPGKSEPVEKSAVGP